ncbi:MAG: hypothetical protein GW795_03905 [Cyanobacteria bacterium]|nr:hypothetical protein [Cyanobacteria bacterium CG_2015-16_32_12]NCO76896.1 hypothetical protein [Cyanobacteria bacterium CG_2015-22_32_23]NCQ03477.1 hypothetical protein [Cyanobacteria bacterium CG_2015-09_32_10]NCQ41040.1 hypothetical protein [Cyanobacteria bacterium CG_2015-04_32_10]NCS84838.1 hypothetical protein [Cyanobacteria bacterium CG_2015-02_32_10]
MKAELILEEKLEKPWWNRPLLGEKTLIDYFFSEYIKLEIPPEILSVYNYALEKSDNITLTLKALLNDKFSNKGFLIYARIEGYLNKYCQHKKHYFIVGKELFKTLLDNLDILNKLTDIEAEYNHGVFLEFYQFALELIQKYPNKLIFQEKLKKAKEYFTIQLNEEQEKKVIGVYIKYLLLLSEVDNLANYFYLVKINQLTNWELLKKIKTFIEENQQSNIEELKPFILLVKNDEDWFTKIATKIIKIKKEDTEDSLIIANILQYIALSYKYEVIYPQFQLFLNYLSKWEKVYYYIISLRDKYGSKKYNYPPNFKVKISGFDIYKSYYDYLDSSYFMKQKH